jgi:hypothetical protein
VVLPRRSLLALALAVWLSEWLFAWTSALGVVGDALSWLWLAGLVVLAGRSLTRTRIPASVLVWMWMAAILGVTIFHAWSIARAGPIAMFSDAAALEQILRDLPAEAHGELRWLANLLDLIVPTVAVGLALAAVASLEIVLVALGLAIGRHTRDAPARIGLAPRLAVTALQLPTLLLLTGLGVALLAGTIAGLLFAAGLPPAALDDRTLAVTAAVRANVGPLLAVGLGLWSLGVIHLRRLLALRDGGRFTRVVLAAFALLPAALVLTRPGPGWSLLLLAWAALQLAALASARPRPSSSQRPGSRTPAAPGR